MMVPRVIEILRKEEAVRLRVYDDATGMDLHPGMTLKGHPTVGVGRALDTNGLYPEEVDFLLQNDIDRRSGDLFRFLPWVSNLDDVRQEVLLMMQFQLGTGGLLSFHDTLSHVKAGRFEDAAREMLESHVAREQAPARWRRLSSAMKTGVWA